MTHDETSGGGLTLDQATDRLTAMISELTGRDVGPDENFFEAGLNSMAVARLRTLVNRRLDVAVPAMAFFEHPTVRAAARRIVQAGVPNAPASEAAGGTPPPRTAASRREIRDRIRRGGPA